MVLRFLEERRNTFSFINQLPTEILTLIFFILQDYASDTFHELFPPATAEELATSHSWMGVITQVCRHWRRTALSTPTLRKNTFIDAKKIHLTPLAGWNDSIPILLIDRSRPAPLHFNCTIAAEGDSEPEGLYGALRDNAYRLETLRISASEFLNWGVFNFLEVPLHLPRLSSLQIRFGGNQAVSRNDMQSEHPGDGELPELFGSVPPNLQRLSRLSLGGLTSWQYNTFPRLTHLSLHDQITTPTVNEFLDILETLPILEVLHLERAGPEIPLPTTTLPTRQIALPNLREARFLVFKPTPLNIQIRILECITVPPFVEILFSIPQLDKRDLHRLLPNLPYCDSVTSINFINPDADDRAPYWAMKLQKNKLTVRTNSAAVIWFLPSLGKQFPHITNILFQNTLPDLKHYYNGEFNNLHSLIAITSCGHRDFCEAPGLIGLLRDHGQVSNDVLCPQLSRITIYAVDVTPENFFFLGPKMLAEELMNEPLKVIHRGPNKDFEVLLISEERIEVLDVRWTVDPVFVRFDAGR